MDRLPSEIKCLIARYMGDECMKSLAALSLVDQEWNRIARPLLYEHIIIRPLKDDVSHKFHWQPEASRVLVHIKRLSIIVPWYPISGPPRAPVLRAYSGLRASLKTENLGGQSIPKFRGCSTNQSAEVIDLIHKVDQLRDIDLLMSNGGPVELHKAIRQYHPDCRSSVYLSPQVGDMYRKTDDWVLSPQLHTAHVTLFEHPERRNFREHPDRVLEDMIIRAPHVKRLALQIVAGGQAGPKEDFSETVVVEGRVGVEPLRAKLEQLAWPLNTLMPAGQFLKWDKLVDYSCLKSWTVGCIEETQVLRAIAGLRPFQQLNRLTLALFPPQDDELSFYTAVEAMFDSLPPLTYLCLLGSYKPALLSTALRKHGPTLLELKLNVGSQDLNHQTLRRLRAKGQSVTGPICSVEEIHPLAAHCPSLQTLCIAIQRNRGLETPAYTALALFPALTTLELYLNCPPLVDPNEIEPPSPVPPRDLTEFEKSQPLPSTGLEVPIWYIRDTMINSAIDKDLAKTIFTHIRSHQVRGQCLTKLKIHPLYSAPAAAARSISIVSNCNIFKAPAPSWTVQTDLLVGVKAVKHMQKQSARRWVSEGAAQLEVIFNSVWPPAEGEEENGNEGKVQELLVFCGIGDCNYEPIKQHILGISDFVREKRL
ncbi:hypothetical protein DTO012A7_7631 [Penicillium roqueforti]|uniref:uncharacterized protein n=1 Tax=Penicillium roqueforti TaxID=5082 RepID=UPI00190CE4FE|nr:uncharacterized protein LCP9604111_6302 [Penicillium roqueforti]KAF9247603.1 hypothetical protein LCP9604111_6302 [Penicillium roqueforti]KAI2712372.1 hypothetical protein CBS147318_7805 [Penicillium roqueforti]KAI3126169.1 hypothetical protein CBS147330_6509 [Penicillium roqueforti]KAI3163903.1 hypothetical protein DTO039G3_7674 [Penicillium roqueforti]KAI3224700.1 hypothetical protein DTO012A7_7631 [Penicillium roqueforti]